MRRTRTLASDIYIRLAPSRQAQSYESIARQSRERTMEQSKTYDAYIYSHLDIDGLSPRVRECPPGGESFMDLPCVSIEQVEVRWNRYEDYLQAFVNGIKDPYGMRKVLSHTLSPGLERLFSGQPLADRPVRIWWHSETPELEDLPWELIAYPDFTSVHNISFVRGKPPAVPPPRVPLQPDAPLRLAYIYPAHGVPAAVDEVLRDLPAGFERIDFPTDPRRALSIAAKEGFELVHLVTDGIVSLAYEGILHLPGTGSGAPGYELSAGELMQLLSGSRVSLLSLSEPDITSADTGYESRRQVPAAYRAFAYFGRSELPLPNVVAPLGPHEPYELATFWRAFYHRLGDSLSVEEATAAGRLAAPAAMALFMRQSFKHTFYRLKDTEQAPPVDVTQANLELLQSYSIVDQIQAVQEQYGDLPESVKGFLSLESDRQAKLQDDLEAWMEDDAEEEA